MARFLVAALFLQLVAPAVGSWIYGADRWIEICTAAGAKFVAAPTNDKGQRPTDKHAKDHCALCSVTGALNEFDAKQYLLAVAPHASPQDHAIESPIGGYSGHAILSRAPPSRSL